MVIRRRHLFDKDTDRPEEIGASYLPVDVAGSSFLEQPTGAPVMHVVHVVRDEDGDVLEVSESIWPADRVIVIDDHSTEQEPEQPTAASEL